jgi:hypothetical protein
MSFYKNFQLYQQGTMSTAATDALRFFFLGCCFFRGSRAPEGRSSPQIVNPGLSLFSDDKSQILCLGCFFMLTPRVDMRVQSPTRLYSTTQKHPLLITFLLYTLALSDSLIAHLLNG